MTGISSQNSKVTPICLLHTEKIAELVLSYVFKLAFPASLLGQEGFNAKHYFYFHIQGFCDCLRKLDTYLGFGVHICVFVRPFVTIEAR